MHPALAAVAASFEHEQKIHYATTAFLSHTRIHPRIESRLEKLVLSLSRRTAKSSSTKPPNAQRKSPCWRENEKKRVCNARDTAELQRTKSNACFTHLDTHSLASTSKTLIGQWAGTRVICVQTHIVRTHAWFVFIIHLNELQAHSLGEQAMEAHTHTHTKSTLFFYTPALWWRRDAGEISHLTCALCAQAAMQFSTRYVSISSRKIKCAILQSSFPSIRKIERNIVKCHGYTL